MNDLRIALRVLRKNPSYATVAVLTLAIGIGSATAIFSVLNAVVLRPLPYADSDRLVLIRDSSPPRLPEFSLSPGRFLEWTKRSRTFESLAAFQNDSVNLTGAGEPFKLRGSLVTATTFPMLGIAPRLGRTFTAEEDRPGNAAEVILSEATWKGHFGADPNIAGRKVLFDDKPFTIIGVMPASFVFPSVTTEYWRPIAFTPQQATQYGSHYITGIGKLKVGQTVEAAQADLARASREIESLDGNHGWTSLVFSYLGYTVRNVRAGLIVLAGAVAVVLLIACANVANLLLARGLGRQRELAVRAALGASRRRLLRQMLSENLVLGAVGSVAGLAIAAGLLKVVTTSSSVTLPRLQTIGLDTPTVLFALGLAVLTPVIFGLLPATQISRTQLRDVLAQGGRGGANALRARTRAILIVGEVALAVMLVASSSLLLRSFSRLVAVPAGFDTTHELVVPIQLPDARYADASARDQFWSGFLERLAQVPGVEAAAFTQSVPFISDYVSVFEIEGITPADTNQSPNMNFYAISDDYFKAMGIPVIRGRVFDRRDTATSQNVVIISKTTADRYFGGVDPIGRRITAIHQGPASKGAAEIIGVVGDIKQYGLDATTTLQMYQPQRQHGYFSSFTLVVRSAASPDALTASVRGVLHDMDPNLPIATARTIGSYVDASTGPQRFTTALLGGFAGIALLLAAIGVYGLVSFAVAQRTQEIGIRMALGARSSAVLGLVVRQGLGLTAVGVVLGALATFWAARWLQAQLFEASTADSVVALLIAPVALLVAAALACYVPSRRALRVEPVTALRHM
jgi:putative ABC transport system permease protein